LENHDRLKAAAFAEIIRAVNSDTLEFAWILPTHLAPVKALKRL
jgi:hypothetical protein